VMAFDRALSSPPLVDALTAEESAPGALKALNTTLYTLSSSQLQSILEKHIGLVVLNVTLDLTQDVDFKKNLIDTLSVCPSLEQVEIVGSPSTEFGTAAKENNNIFQEAFPSEEDMQGLCEKCKKLDNFKANVLRMSSWPSIEWKKTGASKKWTGGVKLPPKSAEVTTNRRPKKIESWSPWT